MRQLPFAGLLSGGTLRQVQRRDIRASLSRVIEENDRTVRQKAGVSLILVVVVLLALSGCGSWEETISEERDLIDGTMETVFPETEYVVSTGSVICEFTDGENSAFIQAEFEVSIEPSEAAAAVAGYWRGRDDTANVNASSDTVVGNADGAVIGFRAASDGIGSISVQGGPCRDGAVPATSVVVTPSDD